MVGLRVVLLLGIIAIAIDRAASRHSNRRNRRHTVGPDMQLVSFSVRRSPLLRTAACLCFCFHHPTDCEISNLASYLRALGPGD